VKKKKKKKKRKKRKEWDRRRKRRQMFGGHDWWNHLFKKVRPEEDFQSCNEFLGSLHLEEE